MNPALGYSTMVPSATKAGGKAIAQPGSNLSYIVGPPAPPQLSSLCVPIPVPIKSESRNLHGVQETQASGVEDSIFKQIKYHNIAYHMTEICEPATVGRGMGAVGGSRAE